MINYPKNLFNQHTVKYLTLNLLLIYNLSVIKVSAQNDAGSIKEKKPDHHKQDISLFGSDEILNISIYFDLEGFLKKTLKSDSYDAEITFRPGERDSINKTISVRYRGLLRRELCSFPPIWIYFKKPLYSDSGKIKKLKLVTHCEPSYKTDDYIIREYLVYKLFNALTDTSLKVRLVKVNYIDNKKIKKTIVKYGILIEPVETLAKRTNCIVLKTMTLKEHHIVPKSLDRLAIFNYMVANWDWSIPKQHNVKIIKPLSFNAGPLGIAVPFDFDLTGVVNADYAIPPANAGIGNVRERIYSGLCRPKEVYIEDLREFLDKKKQIYSAVSNCPQLDQRSKLDITSFLDEFYDLLEKPRRMDMLIENFSKTCKY
jgi:hypothetical protein